MLLTNKKRQRVILSWPPSRLSGTVASHRFPSLQSDYYLSRDQTQWCCVILHDETHNGCTGNYVFLEIIKAVSSVDESTWKHGSRWWPSSIILSVTQQSEQFLSFQNVSQVSTTFLFPLFHWFIIITAVRLMIWTAFTTTAATATVVARRTAAFLWGVTLIAAICGWRLVGLITFIFTFTAAFPVDKEIK